MKITTEQIDQLYTFTRQHYVEWYDLQSELVDHLANAIETEWQEKPKLTFDEILNKEFGKFGVFGFMDVVEERQKFLGKKYNRLIWKYYKEFFRLPKIILTTALIYGVYTFINFFEKPIRIFATIFILELLISGFIFFRMKNKMKQKNITTDKKWLFEDIVRNVNVYSFLAIPFQIVNGIFLLKTFYVNDNWQNLYSILASVFLVTAGLFYYILLKIIPKKVSEELEKTYPEYKFVKS